MIVSCTALEGSGAGGLQEGHERSEHAMDVAHYGAKGDPRQPAVLEILLAEIV